MEKLVYLVLVLSELLPYAVVDDELHLALVVVGALQHRGHRGQLLDHGLRKVLRLEGVLVTYEDNVTSCYYLA